MDEIRIGKVSSVSGNEIKVTYEDRQGEVTHEFPVVSNGVYRVPKVGETIVVLHMSNGSSNGFVLGTLAGRSEDMALGTLKGILEDFESRIKALEEKI